MVSVNARKLAVLLACFALFGRAGVASDCDDPAKAPEWIKNYVQHDFEGSRLSTDVAERFTECVRLPDGQPGWEHVDIIKNFEIAKCDHKKKQYCYVVTYQVLGQMAVGEKLNLYSAPLPQSMEITIGSKSNGKWTLVTPKRFAPKVGAPAARDYLKHLLDENAAEAWTLAAYKQLQKI